MNLYQQLLTKLAQNFVALALFLSLTLVMKGTTPSTGDCQPALVVEAAEDTTVSAGSVSQGTGEQGL